MDDDGAAAREEIIAAKQARATRDRLEARIARERDALGGAQLELQAARGRLAGETEDVERLESFSPTRIWAGLRGRRDADLDRERAEQQQAQYAVASAEAAVARALAEVERSQAERDALGDVDARWEQALAGLDAWLSERGGEHADELRRVTQELAAARSEVVEIGEARAAATEADARLSEARALLGKAGDWAAWDTFGGGGLITDSIKYDRMDQAAAVMRRADEALKRLAGELADVGLAGTGGIVVEGWDRAFDVWFDNIFSDWAVRDRIRAAQDRTAGAQRAVQGLQDQLVDRDALARRNVTTLTDRQAELAAAAAG